jgi:hypothetical protein
LENQEAIAWVIDFLEFTQLIPIFYEDAQNKTLEAPCLIKKLFYAGSYKFGIRYQIILDYDFWLLNYSIAST